MSTIRESAARFEIGDVVSFSFGQRDVAAQIIEDRGPIGFNGRRLYRVRFDQNSYEPIELEIPEDEVVIVKSRRQAVIDYLKSGGLVEILRSSPSYVWLTLDPHGNGVGHTFVPGFVGGKRTPLSALSARGDKILAPMRDAVVKYLATFDVSRQDAEEIVDAVGTSR